MTSKELMYIEDAMGHEKYFQSKCREAVEQISDGELKSFIEQTSINHQQIFQNFYNLL